MAVADDPVRRRDHGDGASAPRTLPAAAGSAVGRHLLRDQNRQVAIKKVAKDADLVIVVGSANSSNSVRLVEVALEYGAKAAYRIDYADEIEQAWLDGVETVGVTSGASVPEVLVQEVLRDLALAGYGDVEEVRTAEEDLMFSLPKELRTPLKGERDPRALGGRTRA